MKYLVLFAVVFAASVIDARFVDDSSSSEESTDVAEAIICITSQGLMEYGDQIGYIMTKDKYPVDDAKFNKFFGCYWKNKGLIDENANLNQENIKTYLQDLLSDGGKVTKLNKAFAQSVVDECKDTKGQGSGQTAVKTQNCTLAYLEHVADL